MSDTSLSNDDNDRSEGRDFRKREYGSSDSNYSEDEEFLGEDNAELSTWALREEDKF